MPGFRPVHWGNATWDTIHSLAQLAEEFGDAALFMLFMLRLSGVLPCADCRRHYTAFLATDWLDTGKMERLMRVNKPQTFATLQHNNVNALLGKPIPPVDPDTVRARYAGCPFKDDAMFRMLMFIVYNYDANGSETKERDYLGFFDVLPKVVAQLGQSDTAEFLASIRIAPGFTQDELVTQTVAALRAWATKRAYDLPPDDDIAKAYDMCRAGQK